MLTYLPHEIMRCLEKEKTVSDAHVGDVSPTVQLAKA